MTTHSQYSTTIQTTPSKTYKTNTYNNETIIYQKKIDGNT
jgi:hypothetical protein